MQISVIIPAYNEEAYLPHLLEDLKAQTFRDFEVIVADAGSSDRTRDLASQLGAKVVDGGLPGPGRNRGAEKARGEFFFFIDSDIRLETDFLEKAREEIESRFLDLATCEFIPLSDLLIDKVLHETANLYIKINQYSNPHAGGFCLIISRRLFRRIGGFDETLKLAEDHDLVKRAGQYRPLRVLGNVKVKISVRRFDSEGRIALSKKYLAVEAYRWFNGDLKKQVVDYQFGNFKAANQAKWEKNLLKLDRKLSGLNEQINLLKDNFSPENFQAQIKLINRNFTKTLDKLKAFIPPLE